MTTRNRGKQPNDDKYFNSKWFPIFTKAIDDLCFLLTREYSNNSALQVVGNRYKLNKRQRNAVLRVSCSNDAITNRNQSKCEAKDVEHKIIEIDGFNLLILLESALSGAFIFKARDGIYRDISSVHGSYKRVMKTEEAILIVGNCLKKLNVKSVKWYLDQPVSNSGRLKTRLREISTEHHFDWEVELVYDPDKVLAKSSNIVVSSDGWILDNAENWFNLGAYLFENDFVLNANIIEV